MISYKRGAGHGVIPKSNILARRQFNSEWLKNTAGMEKYTATKFLGFSVTRFCTMPIAARPHDGAA